MWMNTQAMKEEGLHTGTVNVCNLKQPLNSYIFKIFQNFSVMIFKNT